jgi:hypothetical protein
LYGIVISRFTASAPTFMAGVMSCVRAAIAVILRCKSFGDLPGG